tara:strand:+ start:62 stop:460 length:399 start_codon:yes stop_codon:yes gene_type:complete
MVCTIDFAASFAAMVGTPLPADACLDSFDVIDALTGKKGAAGRDHLVQQDNGRGGNYGFRVGDWKLQRHDSRRQRNFMLRLKARKVPRYALYNLAIDPAEKHNVIAEHPEVARKLISRLDTLITNGRSRPSN